MGRNHGGGLPEDDGDAHAVHPAAVRRVCSLPDTIGVDESRTGIGDNTYTVLGHPALPFSQGAV